MKFTIISAINNEAVLKSCLLDSPAIDDSTEVVLRKGYASAAEAYNPIIDKASSEIQIFVHQDVYLPEGWIQRVENVLAILERDDPNWGVLGIWGVGADGSRSGHLYCIGSGTVYGHRFDQPVEVRTLDEALLIVRVSSGLRFDDTMRGFHMYGTDLCLEAKRRGMKSYAISAFCLHNSNEYRWLPLSFWKNCLFVRNKWKSELPIIAPCIEVTFWGWPMIFWNLARARNIILRGYHPRRRIQNPGSFFTESLLPMINDDSSRTSSSKSAG